MNINRWSLTALLFFWPATAAAVEVTASGEAQLGVEDLEKVEQIALGRALTHALEKVVGITVQSEFTADMRERVANNQNQFEADVRDRVLKQSKGFISKYEIVERSEVTVMGRRMLRVTVQADVYESKVKAEVKRLAELLEAAGNPRVMVIVQELVREQDGTLRVMDTPQLATNIEKAFQREGFLLQGGTRAKELRAVPYEDFVAFQQDGTAALAAARAEGADVVVTGRMVIKDRGKIGDAAPFKSLAGRVKIEVEGSARVLIVSTGELVSPAPLIGNEFGANFDRAVHRFFYGSKGRGKNVVEKFMNDILPDVKARLEKMATEGRQWLVELQGVENFRRQGRPFLRMLGEIPGVTETRQRTFAKGRLEVEVNCRCSSTELQERVFEAAEQNKSLRALDLAESGAGRLGFKL